MITALIITNIITFLCMITLGAGVMSKRIERRELESVAEDETKQIVAKSDFETARDWLSENLNTPGEWKLIEDSEKRIDEKLRSGTDFTVVNIISANVDHAFEKKNKPFRMRDFSPAEQVELVDVHYDAWAKRVDKYVESKLAVDNAKVIAARKHQSRMEARKSTTELVEGTDSWDAEFAEAQADNSGTEKQSVKILKSIGRGLSSALLPQ